MEEYDDLVSNPSEDGKLELSYRGWTLVDDVVFTMGRELLVLDISFNAITELPPELGDLVLIKELNCSCNHLKEFPKQLGKLRNLRYLKCNGNKLVRLPEEIGQCTQLRKVVSGENLIQAVPLSLSKLTYLEELHFCNNRLTVFAPVIGLNKSLKIIDLGNNPDLKHMIPVKLQGNTEFIVWMCAKWWITLLLCDHIKC
jgi:Leucine-rich repeat (LRR) protein